MLWIFTLDLLYWKFYLLLSIQYVWTPFSGIMATRYIRTISGFCLLSNTDPCPNYIPRSYYSSTGCTVNAYHSRITYIHVMVTLVIQLMLTIVYLRIYNSLLFSIALLYRTMLYTCIHTRMSLDYLSSSTIYIIPYHADFACLRIQTLGLTYICTG